MFPFRHLFGWPVLALTLLSAAAPEALAETVTRGPYLQSGTPESVVVRWRSDQATDSLVRYGDAPDNLELSVTSATPTTEHELTVSGLAAGSRYYYSVGSSTSAPVNTDTSHSFVTAPATGTSKPTRIWVIGDSGTANANAAAVYNAYNNYTGSRATDLWLMLGDNAYGSGTDTQYQNAVFDMYPELLRQSVLWPTLGNHDGYSADSATESGPYYDIFTLPVNAEAGGLASGTEAYYSFDYGAIHFVCLESYETDRSTGGAMLTWLQNDLAATNKPWIIAFWHHPPYTKGSHDSDTEVELVQMRENALPILEAHGVDLVLSGHSHSYERSFLLDGHYGTSTTLQPFMVLDGGDGRVTGDGAYSKNETLKAPYTGAVYAVAGSSGKTSGGSLNHPAMVVSLNQLGSMVLDVDGNRLDGVFLASDGNVQDSFTILKGSDTSPPDIVSVEANDGTTVTVAFTEPLDPTRAENPANYGIDQGISVSAALLEPDQRSVVLTTSALTEGTSYTLTVDDVADIAGNPVAPNAQATFTFVVLRTAQFQDGVAPAAAYAGTRDTTISESAPDTNFGANAVLLADGDDPPGSGTDLGALLAWDIGSLPADAVVESASVTINVTNATNGTYGLYGLLRDWQEDEATWNQHAAGNPWGSAGASGPGDRGGEVLGTVQGAGNGGYTVMLNEAGRNLVQDWIDGTAPNHGFMLASGQTTDGLDFSSREAVPASRPRLTVIYSVPPNGGDTTAPSTPGNLQATNVESRGIGLVWDASSDDTGVTGYKIFRDGQLIDTTDGLAYADTGLEPDTTYAYTLAAFDAANNESGPGSPLVITTLAEVASVHVNDIAIQLRNAGKSRYARSQVTILDSGAGPVSGATVTADWSGLTGNSVNGATDAEGVVSFDSGMVSRKVSGQFVFTVAHVSAAGSLYDPAANLETWDCIDTTGASCQGPGGLAAPTGLMATPAPDRIDLDWNAGTDPSITGYRVYRAATSGTGYAEVASTGQNGYSDTNVAAGQTWYYVVTALDASADESPASNEASATVPDPGGLVMHVNAIVVTAARQGKNWSGEAVVSIHDAADGFVAGASISGDWTVSSAGGGDTGLGSVTGTTGVDGSVTLKSAKWRATSGDSFRFDVTNVTRAGAGFDVGASVTFGFASVP